MGANESRQAETEQEERKNEGGGFFSKAVTAVAVVGTAAILAGGAVAMLSSDSKSEQIEKFAEQGSSSNPTIPRDEKLISWDPPSPGWMKINTDGSVKENGEAAAGGLLRDSKGQWVKGFTFYIGPGCTPVLAELHGVIKGLELARKFGCKKLEVETDNEGVVHMINYPRNRQNDNYKLVSDIKQLLQKDWEVNVQLCNRKQNRCADKLATYGFEEPLEYRELSQPPASLVGLLEQDSMSEARPIRFYG